MNRVIPFIQKDYNNILYLVTDKICAFTYDERDDKTTVWCGGGSRDDQFYLEGDCIFTIEDAIHELYGESVE